MPSVAVLGGGYAGIRAVRKLAVLLPGSWSITLIDRHSCHQLMTRLPEVVSGATPPGKACIPYARLCSRRIKIQCVEVRSIDPGTRIVETSRGRLTPDVLLVTLGTSADFMNIPGAKEHGMVLKSLNAAVSLRAALEQGLHERRIVRVALIGAGYTGTELAGELAEWDLKIRRSGGKGGLRVTLVADAPYLLPEGNVRLRQIAQSVLEEKGVSLRLGVPVETVEKDRVILRSSDQIEADIVVWAARTSVPPPLRTAGWARGRDGRITVDPYLRAVGCERIYVAGDSAWAHDHRLNAPVPATAQFGALEGEMVALNVAAFIQGRALREFSSRGLGEALSLGGADGAAEIAGVVISGRIAAAAKRAALLRYLSSLGGPRLAAQFA